jgi:membrane protein implicated in regulation of membrane protease activity
MWLPEPVYKSLPTFYAAMGACFIVGVFYIGLEAPLSPVYLAMGLVSILASITVSVWRSRIGAKMQNVEGDEQQGEKRV